MESPSSTDPASRGEGTRFSADSLLQAAFLAGRNPVFLVDTRTREILACTGDIDHVFGYRRKELLGRSTRILHVDQASYEAFTRDSEAVLELSDSYRAHSRMRRRDGTVFPSEHLVQVIRDDTGRPHVAISIVRDLTDSRRDLLNALPATRDESAVQSLRDRLPGAVYQRVQTPDGTSRFTFLAGSLFRDYGLDPDTARVDPEAFYGRLLGPDREALEAALARGQASMTPVECEVQMRMPTGEHASLRILTQPRPLDDGSVLWDGFALDVTAERSAEEQFHYLTTHDALTGLLNRGQFLRHLQDAIGQSHREQERIAVATLGIQAMMEINATHGLERGDEFLRQVGNRLREHLSGDDLAARGHGDVFFILLRLPDGDQYVGQSLGRLARVFDAPFQLDDGTSIAASARIGLATYPADATDAAALLNASTIAFDRAPHGPQVGYEFYAEELGQLLRQRMERERALADAIAAGELVPHFQPQVSLTDGSLIGLEALVRWQKADGSLVPPAEFIPLAEDSGLIVRLDIAIMKAVTAQIRDWQAAGLEPPPVAVNCSARQFRDGDLARVCREVIDESGIDPSLLVIEITESSLLDDYQAAETTMTALTEMGIQFSIDDFGTGFSSLNYIAHLPFHTLKIDRSFITLLETDARQTAISELLVNMGTTLALNVVAEGVEEQSQATYLQHIGCQAAQGFLYASPMPASEVSAWLPRRSATI